MADYWISQPRHYCEFCKCWIGDNKPSRDFHEKGKNHQKNVQLKISEVLKKGQKAAMEKTEMDNTMKQIEEAALKALKKDLTQDPSLAAQYGVRIKPKESKEATCDSEKPNITEKKTDSPVTKESSISSESEQSKEEDPNLLWKEEWTPEGFVYYWQTETGESRWVKPDGYVPTWERAAKDILKKDDEDDNIEFEPATSNTTETDTSQPEPKHKEIPTESLPEKPSLPLDVGDIPLPANIPLHVPLESKAEVPEVPVLPIPDIGPPTKSQSSHRATTSAYGQWQTAAEETDLPPVDLELPISSDAVNIEVKVIPIISEPKIKFRQKKVDTLGAEFVAFKKRKLAGGQKRSIRTTDTEKSQKAD